MITNNHSWSLNSRCEFGLCLNKSLNDVEPPVPPHQSDPFHFSKQSSCVHRHLSTQGIQSSLLLLLSLLASQTSAPILNLQPSPRAVTCNYEQLRAAKLKVNFRDIILYYWSLQKIPFNFCKSDRSYCSCADRGSHHPAVRSRSLNGISSKCRKQTFPWAATGPASSFAMDPPSPDPFGYIRIALGSPSNVGWLDRGNPELKKATLP